MQLDGKIAIVTGAASGFGAGIAERFVAEGARVTIADLDRARGAEVAAAFGDRARFVAADVSRGADFAGLVEATVGLWGGLDILVNNAGITHKNGPMAEVSEDEFDRIYAVNVKPLYHTARHAVPVMQARGRGVVLNIASTAGVRPRPGLTWYNGSKGAVITLTRSMAVELAPTGVRVCALNPVAGETPLLARFLGEDTPERRAAFRATVPLGRFSTPADVANAAVFLCADAAGFLTGVCLEVDGGRCI